MYKTLFALIILTSALYSNGQNKDAFMEMMNLTGIEESTLGYKPVGYWSRYPLPSQIPFKINSFDALMAEPYRIYDYINVMSTSVNDFLHPEYLDKNRNGLMKVGFYCGVMPLNSQFRAYGSSLWADVSKQEPLLNAIKEVYLRTNTVYRYNRMGEAADYPLIERDLKTSISAIAPEVQAVVADAVINLTEAWRFVQIGMRNVKYEDAVKVWRIRHLGETQFDGMEYYPELEDCAKNIDMSSIYYAGLKLMEVSEKLSDTLIKLKNSKLKISWKDQNLNIVTPIGRIVIAGTSANTHQYSDALLVIDLGGNDVYIGPTGSTPSLSIPVSLAIDLEGNDKYLNDDEYIVSQGAAVFGAAMLLDISGNDEYHSKRLSQGAAMLGMGILADMSGDDTYDLWTDGQGAAWFGVGMAIDVDGDDKYKLWGDGQGFGGCGGVGTLINRSGNDYYFAEADTAKVYRMDRWHSHKGQYNYTYCQGAGIGRRGDITDGHSWAGGMGTLIDLSGDDTYIAGGWSQACGYWYGMGFLWDGNGNDKYKATHWSQACGAHFCIGAMFDEGGDDTYEIWEKLAAGMCFGHDYTISILLNKKGNDKYKLKDDGLGYAINKSQVFFFDTDGDDTYITEGKGHNYGWNNFDKSNPPGVEMVYHLYSDQVCFFADLNGADQYLTEDFDTKKTETDKRMKDGAEYFVPTKAEIEKLPSDRYYGLGKDFSGWKGEDIRYFDSKIAPKYK